jgi:hypothetical protein
MLLILAAINFILAQTDAHISARRMKKYGVQAEFNKLAKFLHHIMGPDNSAMFSILPLAVLQSVLCVHFNLPVLLGFFVGIRFKLAHTQLLSLSVEKQLDNLLGGKRTATLPVPSDNSLPSHLPPDFPKEQP